MSEQWIRSQHISWFGQRETLYLYHDLFGYLIAMPHALRAVVDAFASPRTLSDANSELRRTDLPRDLSVRAAVETLVSHDCLVTPGTDEVGLLVHRVPVKSRWIVVHRQRASTVAYVSRHRGDPVKRVVFNRLQRQVWDLIDGERTVATIADALSETDEAPSGRQVAAVVAAWTHSDLQLTRLSVVPMSFYAHGTPPPPYLSSTMPFDRVDGPAPPTEHEEVIDLGDYHRHEIVEAERQFDETETTLSHLFRHPHPALGGRRYGEAFVEAMTHGGLLDRPVVSVIEVGGGLGYFAAAAAATLGAQRNTGEDLDYCVVDISPALQEAQRARLAGVGGTRTLTTDGERLEEVASGSVDLLVSNEVIADFRTGRIQVSAPTPAPEHETPDEMLARLEEAGDDGPVLTGHAETVALLERYGIDLGDHHGEVLINTGAIRFVETIWRVLRPGGAAVVSEFGDRWRLPVESTHLDHAEVSIHFGHLLTVASDLGFSAELVDLPDFLGLDGDARSLITTGAWWRAFRSLLTDCGIEAPKVAYTDEMLRELCGANLALDEVEHLHWGTLGERTMGLEPRDFKVLILRKPTS